MCPFWVILSSTPGSPEVKETHRLCSPAVQARVLIKNLTGFVDVLGGLPTTREGPDSSDIASGNSNNLLQVKANLRELQSPNCPFDM